MAAEFGTFLQSVHNSLQLVKIFSYFDFVPGNNGPEYIIYSNATHISYVPVDGGDSTVILPAQSATLGYDEKTYRLWYHDTVSVNLHHTRLDASNLQTVSVPSTFGPFAVDSVNQTIYYVNDADMSVKSINYNGVHFLEIAELQSDDDFKDIQIDAENRYVATYEIPRYSITIRYLHFIMSNWSVKPKGFFNE